VNVKPSSLLAVNGTLFAGVSCINYGDDPMFNRQHNLAGFLMQSQDWGRSWQNVTAVGAFAGRFAAPMFVSCGQNNNPCRERNGGFLYVFFPGAFDNAAYWCQNDALFLARVPEASVGNLSSYEYFLGLTETGPAWAADSRQAQPVLEYGRMVGENAMFFHPGLNRYLMANYGFLDAAGNPRPWHQEPILNPHRTQLVMLEAPEPWGPWTRFFHTDNTAIPGLYTPTFPSQLMGPVVGDQANLTMFFSCLDGPSTCQYSLNWQNITLSLNLSEAGGRAS
jgi:hypothetical protein